MGFDEFIQAELEKDPTATSLYQLGSWQKYKGTDDTSPLDYSFPFLADLLEKYTGVAAPQKLWGMLYLCFRTLL